MTSLSIVLLLLVHFTHQKPLLNPRHHLHKYGFLNSTNPTEKTLEEAIMKFQEMNGLETTGTMNTVTMDRMGAPRCGQPSNVPEFARTKNRWEKAQITYKIANWSEPFTKAEIRKVFEDAIMSWTDDVNLKIIETDSVVADIIIYFTQQDGLYNVLGYAYYPENGDIYFDTEEDWTFDAALAATKTYFGWVAAHELGHSLGLPHSETMKSIMFPYYSTRVINPSDIDTQALRSIYGKATMNNSILCDGSPVDAILDAKAPMIIKERQYWVLSDGHIQSGPFPVRLLYPQLPRKIDAAFMVGSASYFLAGNRFYRAKSKRKFATAKLISVGFDNIPSDINAAFYDPSGQTIYFFKGSKYYGLEVKKPVGKRVTIDGKETAKDWGGVPENIDAASLIGDSEVLFVKDSKCYVVDLNSRQLKRTDDCAKTFYGCHQ